MHVVVSWDIKTEGPRWSEIDDGMRTALKPHSWVRPLSTFYIVRVASDVERRLLKDRLREVVTSVPEKVHYIVTPAMVGGSYSGWLPKDMWEKINLRTQQ